MGKKKSVVLLTLITIVIVVLCAVAVFPSFHLSVFKKDSVKTWNPVVSLYDTDEELGGGYVARYYPAGVISATEYDSNCRSISQQEGEVNCRSTWIRTKNTAAFTFPETRTTK